MHLFWFFLFPSTLFKGTIYVQPFAMVCSVAGGTLCSITLGVPVLHTSAYVF